MTDTQIVKMLSNGYTVREIATKEETNLRTMEARIIRIKDKALADNLPHLVANYFREGLIK